MKVHHKNLSARWMRSFCRHIHINIHNGAAPSRLRFVVIRDYTICLFHSYTAVAEASFLHSEIDWHEPISPVIGRFWCAPSNWYQRRTTVPERHPGSHFDLSPGIPVELIVETPGKLPVKAAPTLETPPARSNTLPVVCDTPTTTTEAFFLLPVTTNNTTTSSNCWNHWIAQLSASDSSSHLLHFLLISFQCRKQLNVEPMGTCIINRPFMLVIKSTQSCLSERYSHRWQVTGFIHHHPFTVIVFVLSPTSNRRRRRKIEAIVQFGFFIWFKILFHS